MKVLGFTTKAAVFFLGIFAIFYIGYSWIADYGDDVASGTYRAIVDGQRTTLILKPDHTFHQTRQGSRALEQGNGTWRRIGEGGLVFSGTMLPLPNQRLMPNGDAYATLNKTAGIWPPFISLDSVTTAPIYRKGLLGH